MLHKNMSSRVNVLNSVTMVSLLIQGKSIWIAVSTRDKRTWPGFLKQKYTILRVFLGSMVRKFIFNQILTWSERYGEKEWFNIGMNDGQRFGQNLYFSYLDKKSIATVPVDEWHGEIVQYHYVCPLLNP